MNALAKRRAQRRSWEVRMKCVVYKTVIVEGCTNQEAHESPWAYAIDETETDQADWEVLEVRPNE